MSIPRWKQYQGLKLRREMARERSLEEGEHVTIGGVEVQCGRFNSLDPNLSSTDELMGRGGDSSAAQELQLGATRKGPSR